MEKVRAGEPTVWSSPLHIAKKADGSLRPVGDYRALNLKTQHDSFPLPCLKNETPKFKDATIFSTIDLFRAYYQIELSPEASAKTCILTPWGAYKYLRLPMGLKNSGQSFLNILYLMSYLYIFKITTTYIHLIPKYQCS